MVSPRPTSVAAVELGPCACDRDSLTSVESARDRVAWTEEDGKRPMKFDSKAGEGARLITLERMKK